MGDAFIIPNFIHNRISLPEHVKLPSPPPQLVQKAAPSLQVLRFFHGRSPRAQRTLQRTWSGMHRDVRSDQFVY